MPRAGTRRKNVLGLLACAPMAFLALATAWSCAAAPDETRLTTLKEKPDFDAFKNGKVSEFLERRCGTLDCHGRIERPLRIYGERGLRLPNDGDLVPGSGKTTDAEYTANYRSVVGLEPEQLNRVVTGEDPSILLLISKPLAYDPDVPGTDKGVRHRGGPQILQGGDGYRCLYDWLGRKDFNQDSATACDKASKQLELTP
ncbi:hypothetical protein LVJ94_08205 [Pendulispora rubella]|uniref:Lipoprotein n=1 Tax=Pendulispora rubella TaxID=2741070 RepID=A0ABZ2LBP1_9BACT